VRKKAQRVDTVVRMADRLDRLHEEHLAYLKDRWTCCHSLANTLIGHRKNEDLDDEAIRARHVFELTILVFSFSALHFIEFLGERFGEDRMRGLGS
jgi:hypothetical protein